MLLLSTIAAWSIEARIGPERADALRAVVPDQMHQLTVGQLAPVERIGMEDMLLKAASDLFANHWRFIVVVVAIAIILCALEFTFLRRRRKGRSRRKR